MQKMQKNAKNAKKCKKNKNNKNNKKIHDVGFEPTLPKEPDLKSGALDHSANRVQMLFGFYLPSSKCKIMPVYVLNTTRWWPCSIHIPMQRVLYILYTTY